MPDPIWKRFGYGQLWPLRPVCSQNRAGSYICQIRLSASDLGLGLRPGSYCAKPARIRSGWFGQILAKGIWSGSKPVCWNLGARFWQNATGPQRVSRFQNWLHHSSTDGGDDDDDVELHVLGCRVDILGTNCDQCLSTVQCFFTSTETVRLIRTESPGRPPRFLHSSWTLNPTNGPHLALI